MGKSAGWQRRKEMQNGEGDTGYKEWGVCRSLIMNNWVQNGRTHTHGGDMSAGAGV